MMMAAAVKAKVTATATANATAAVTANVAAAVTANAAALTTRPMVAWNASRAMAEGLHILMMERGMGEALRKVRKNRTVIHMRQLTSP